ncbi:uncharacterized protein BJ212DRAFT_1305590 [Suillus subaureus]|uniref:Uncharacterized protein n=1 Tax=Suillus subaureus TaxID=48587 RepID=A0A9P7DNE9_9AGAM|nr:uncharacterized protein BJ212DRAFT_1305590 [Suillus subaureus]KAG1799138.1 hypothetical protein BJ212DRAFT_1305590 [Suillus subaureus]
MYFSNVSFDEFAIVLNLMSGDERHFLKAKMTYFPHTMILIVYSPLPVHDQMTSEISSVISSALHSLLFTRSLLMVNVIPSHIYSEDIFTIPDMQITLTPTTSEVAETKVLWYTETVFSQSKRMALKKIEKVLLTHRKILFILFILISKQTHYEAPTEDSLAYNEALADKSLCPYTFFSPHRDANKLFGPVKAMDHDWINVSKVKYFVWLKEDNKDININNPHMAYGTLFLVLDMGQISIALNQGMDMVKSVMRTKLDVLQPAVNHTNLLTPSAIVFDWDTDITFMSVAVYKTAHFRYCDWYHRNFNGTKHHRMNNGGDEPKAERPSNRRVIMSSSSEGTSSSGDVDSSEGTTSSGDVDSAEGSSSSEGSGSSAVE